MRLTRRELRRLIKEEMHILLESADTDDDGDIDLSDVAADLESMTDTVQALQGEEGDPEEELTLSDEDKNRRHHAMDRFNKLIQGIARYLRQAPKSVIAASGSDFNKNIETLENTNNPAELKSSAEFIAQALYRGQLAHQMTGGRGMTSKAIKDLSGVFYQLSKEVETLSEIRASPGSAYLDWPDRPLVDLTSLGHPPEGSVSFMEPDEPDLDPDDDSDDEREILDFIIDSLSPDEARAFEYMLRARRQGETKSDFIRRRFGGDPEMVMRHIIPGR